MRIIPCCLLAFAIDLTFLAEIDQLWFEVVSLHTVSAESNTPGSGAMSCLTLTDFTTFVERVLGLHHPAMRVGSERQCDDVLIVVCIGKAAYAITDHPSMFFGLAKNVGFVARSH